MGNMIGGLFGGGGDIDTPDVDPAPVRQSDGEPEAKAARDNERRKQRARAGGVSGTLLTGNKLGSTGASGGNASGLLGRSI